MRWSSDRKEKRVPKRMEAAKRIWANPVSSMGLPPPDGNHYTSKNHQEREQMCCLFLEISCPNTVRMLR